MQQEIRAGHDRYTRILVTVAAAGVWMLIALMLATAGSDSAADEPGVARLAEASARAGAIVPVSGEVEAAAPVSGNAATQPLRWIVPFAKNSNPAAGSPGDLECLTLLRIMPLPGVSTDVEVEFFNGANALDGDTVDVNGLVGNVQVVSDLTFSPDPVFSSGAYSASTGFLSGHARVFSSDPRIMIAPFLLCEINGDGSVEVVTPLPATPIGATVDFFQAAVPGSTVEGSVGVSPSD